MTDSDDDNTEHNHQCTEGSQHSQDQEEACLIVAPEDENNEESLEETENDSYLDFLSTFYQAKGAIQIIAIACFLSLGLGCTVGVVPDLMADRYARLRHGFDGEDDCSSFDRIDKPVACQQGSDDAQQAAAMSTLALNVLTLCFNSILGGLSDVRGRRVVLIVSTFLATLSPIVLVMMQRIPTMDPVWFYASNSAVGLVNYISVSFAALSDVIPPKYRTPGFGLFMGSFYLWFCFSPSLPLFFTHYQVSLFSCVVVILGFVYTVVALPETLPPDVAEGNRSRREDRPETSSTLLQVTLSPLLSLSILNRTTSLRLVAVGSFLSGIVYSSDATLALYYMEDQLNVRDSDLASMFIVMGIVGVLIQSFLLKFLIGMMGEKRLLVVTFCSGTIHNLCYGLAKTKLLLYVALSLSQLTKANFPILSSIAASNVNTCEQGQIQGALFALAALANAIGPMALQYVYQCTKDTSPGTMFVVAALLYLIGTVCVSFVPPEKQQDAITEEEEEEEEEEEAGNSLEEPLLGPNDEES